MVEMVTAFFASETWNDEANAEQNQDNGWRYMLPLLRQVRQGRLADKGDNAPNNRRDGDMP